MSETMTSRQRMLAAIRNQKPDRVPVAPDISNMVPTRLTGRGYLSVYAHEDPPLWRAYIFTYLYGKRLMRPLLQGPDRLAVFRRFLTEQVTPSQLAATV